MDYSSLAGGGGGYSGEVSSKVSSGGTSRAAFGTVNFGAGAKVGGTSTSEGDAGTGQNQNQILLYVGVGVIALVALFVLIRR